MSPSYVPSGVQADDGGCNGCPLPWHDATMDFSQDVSYVIGFKCGTGGTEGVACLRKMLDAVTFPELWRIRKSL